MTKMHQAALAPPDRSSSRNTSVMMDISSQNQATNSMNQKMETITSHKLIACLPSLVTGPTGCRGRARYGRSLRSSEHQSLAQIGRSSWPPPEPLTAWTRGPLRQLGSQLVGHLRDFSASSTALPTAV